MQILLSEPRFCLCNSTQRGSRSVPDMASGRSNSALWINPEDPLGYRSTLKLSLVTNQVLNSGTPPRNPQRRSRHYPFSPTGFFFFAHCSPALCAKKRTELHAGNTRAHRRGTLRTGEEYGRRWLERKRRGEIAKTRKNDGERLAKWRHNLKSESLINPQNLHTYAKLQTRSGFHRPVP